MEKIFSEIDLQQIVTRGNSLEKIIITDMHGKTVKELTSYNGPLDTTDFASGMYFVRFPSGEVSKIIKP